MSEENLQVIFVSLRNGLGLTKACKGINIQVKEVSEFLRNNPEQLNEANKQCALGFKNLLSVSNSKAAKKDITGWKSNNELIKSFINEVNLWEDYSRKEDVNQVICAQAMIEAGDTDEAATLIGMTKRELNEYLMMNPTVLKYVKKQRGVFQ